MLQINGKYLFNPLGKWRIRWTLFIMLIVMYSVLSTPFRIAWPTQSTLAAEVVDYVIDFFFFLDILTNFNTAYIDSRTEALVYDYNLIAKKYISFWFWADLIPCIPIDAILNSSNISNYIHVLKLLRLIRLVRITKLFRSNVGDSGVQLNRPILNLLILVMQIVFMCHLFACAWHYVTLFEGDNNWVTYFGFDNSSPLDTYVASFYFITVTMLTVGYGDIHATTDTERALSVAAMLTAGIIFGALLSKVATLIEKQNPRAKAYKEKIAELREYLQDSNLPAHIQAEAKVVTRYLFI